MKYIVYKTTNLVNNYIYIGVHKTSSPYSWDKYLGCGVRTNKPSTYEKAKTAFQQAVKEFGCSNFRRETLAVFDTAEEAYNLEGILVNEEFLARDDVYNMILGGYQNYASGRIVYEYSTKTGELFKEYKTCVEAADAIGCRAQLVSRGAKMCYKVFGHIFSYIKSDKIDVTLYSNPNESVTVFRYFLSGEYDCEFSSLTKASQNTFDTNPHYIHCAAIFGYQVKDTYYFSLYKESSYDKARSKQILNREVYQYDSDGNYIKSYSSQKLAELENPYCNITKSVKLKTPDKNGNYWGLSKVSVFCKKLVRQPAKKVAKLDSDGKILQTWDSYTSCVKEVGSAVQHVLHGERDKHKGFKYKYIE